MNYTLLLQDPNRCDERSLRSEPVLRYVIQHYREDLRRMLKTELELKLKRLEWTRGFEEYLRSPPKIGL